MIPIRWYNPTSDHWHIIAMIDETSTHEHCHYSSWYFIGGGSGGVAQWSGTIMTSPIMTTINPHALALSVIEATDRPLTNYADLSTRDALGERRDCTVRALAIACNISYIHAHSILSRAGRIDGRGFRMDKFMDAHAILRFGGRTIAHITPINIDSHSRTVGRFTYFHPFGAYILTISGHCLAVTSGVIRDYSERPRCRVERAWAVATAIKIETIDT